MISAMVLPSSQLTLFVCSLNQVLTEAPSMPALPPGLSMPPGLEHVDPAKPTWFYIDDMQQQQGPFALAQ
eukprot:SAG31_NODE_5125_length_2727_cov_1.282725_2_plen_70_part_00